MPSATYDETKGRLELYFDRTATETWKRLTSDAPVSRIRATVRAGRDRMRTTLLSCLPTDLTGRRVLDAGCGVGQMSAELAARGAEVVAVDLSPSLIGIARSRTPAALAGQIDYRAGDMLDPSLGHFDHVVAMDSLIHYAPADMVSALDRLAERTGISILYTIAPRTLLLGLMHLVGKAFPRSDRSPAIHPVRETVLRQRLAEAPGLGAWRPGRAARISSGFYISQKMELIRR
jgi:magnesium-protoporphyrin O-methyltransferase